MTKKALIIGVLLTIIFGVWCSNYLTYNFNIDPLAFGKKQQKEQYETYKNAFKSNKEAITIGIKKSDSFTRYSDFLSLKKLTTSIQNIEGVEKVTSIVNLEFPINNGFFTSYTSFLPLTSGNEFQKKYNTLDNYIDITEKFISADRTSISFYVHLNKKNDSKTMASIQSILKQNALGEHHILGAQVFEAEGNDVLKRETLLITVFGIFLLLVSMILLTPSIKRILITIMFTVFNVCATLVFMYVFNFEITTLTTIIPSVIAILSFTDITHILHYYEQLVSKKTAKIKKKLFTKIGFPLLLTSLSNLFGFIVYFFNGGVHQITDLAIVATFGILFAYVSSRFLLPFLLDYKVVKVLKQHIILDSLLTKCVNIVSSYHKKIVLFFVVLFFAILIPVAKNAKINMQYYEKENTALAINKACAFYDNQFQGIRDIEVVIKAKKGTILNEASIKKIDTIEHFLLTKYGCKTTYSVNTIIKRFQRYKNAGNPKAFKVPSKITTGLLNRLEKNQEELDLLSVVDQERTTTRIIGSLPDIGTHKATSKNKELQQFLSKLNSKDLEIYLNGKAYLFDENVLSLSQFILVALLFGVLFTGVITAFLFKSFWVGLTTFIANLLPLLFGVLMMTFLNIDLNPSSIFILTILFGVALDDSIYLLGHLYKTDTQKTFTKKVLLLSLKTNSAPLLITTIVLSILFLSLTLSSYYSLFTFGLIISTSLLFAFISDLFLIPSLLLSTKYKK